MVPSSTGHDVASAKHYNESHAIISSGDNLRDLQKNDEDEEEEEELSLAEKLQLQNKEDNAANGSIKHKKKTNAGTLTVVLVQALKSNDHSLLETVLNNRDESIIRNTIYKMESSYAVKLIDRLSERISRNGNRQLNLNFWVKNILIYHGNYLIHNMSDKSNLNSLISVLNAKSKNLNRLMELRAKIGMVTDILEMKRDMAKVLDEEPEEEEIEENVEYIEELDDAGLLDGDDDADMDGSSDVEEEDEEDGEDMEVDGDIDDEDDQYSDVDEYDEKLKGIVAAEKGEDEDQAVLAKVKQIKKSK
ncbi:unnamed protein product [Ambrosiozyma monospora]|uniref:Unnamed protein product n=1 Tax=Ambrosiozyma monospora TaxID=43982 RepID=A0ACB5TR50_AMBMO|nr:unnamed protein product [Ambrosiozyma monospora]